MTRKKIQPIYGFNRADHPGLHTWHEEPGYEDWIMKREHLASMYYQEPGYGRRDEFQQPDTHTWTRGVSNQRATRHDAMMHKKSPKDKRRTPKPVEIDVKENNSKLTRTNSSKRRANNMKMENEINIKDENINKVSKFSLDTLVKDPEPLEELSMWSCRRCTLDNDLREKVCGACGGSRLCSIGDIDIPRMFRCDKVEEMIEEAEKNKVDFIRRRENIDMFERNKRLSKIEDDDDDNIEEAANYFQILDLIDPKSIFALVVYVIIFILIFNF